MAERDPEVIKQEIDAARERLATTVDTLADRANPRRLADAAKSKVLAFVQKPAVTVTLVGIGVVVTIVVIRRITR